MRQKVFSKMKLSLLLAMIFTLLSSTMAFAATPYYTYYYNYYSPQKTANTNYYNSNYYRNYNYWNWGTSYQKPTPQPNPTPTPTPESTPQPTPEPTPAPTPQPTQGLSADEQKMIDLVNKERTSQGLEPLKVDMQLVKLARMKSQDMVDNNYFSHTSPTYGSPFDMMKKNGVSYRTAGENLAGASNVDTAHKNLMNSDGHRKNILSPNYTHIGIGVVNGSQYGKIYTQLFIGK